MRYSMDAIVQILRERECDSIRTEGDEVWCCCPLPDHEDDNPSFSINVEKGLYNCFRCGGGLVSELLTEWGIEPKSLTVQTTDGDVLSHVSITLEEALAGRKPHRKRATKIRPGKVSRVGVRYLRTRGFSREDIKRLAREWGVRTDGFGFGTKLVFPVEDPHGGLAFEATRSPFRKQWMYQRGSPKSQTLYGLGHAVRAGATDVIVAEGVFDVLRLWTLGFHAVGLLGANVSDRQIALLSQFDVVIWMLDADQAGRSGTVRNWFKTRGHGIEQFAVDVAPRGDPAEIESADEIVRILSKQGWRPDEKEWDLKAGRG